nr:SpoIIE family protein phosphatase [Succinivibrionaceae bacterium]
RNSAVAAGAGAVALLLALLLLAAIFGSHESERRRLLDLTRRAAATDPADHEALRAACEFHPQDWHQPDLRELASGFTQSIRVLSDRGADLLDECRRNAITERDLTLSREASRAMQPSNREMPNSKILDIAAYLVPAPEPSGDFYEAFRIDGENIGLICGGTSANGLGATFMMGQAASIIKSLLMGGISSARAAAIANMRLRDRNPGQIGISVIIVVLSERTGNFVYTNAGGLCALQLREDGLQALDKFNGQALGLSLSADYHEQTGHLEFGEGMLICSPGLMETRNPQHVPMGEAQITELASSGADLSPTDLLIKLNKHLRLFRNGAPTARDVGAICIRRNDIYPNEGGEPLAQDAPAAQDSLH